MQRPRNYLYRDKLHVDGVIKLACDAKEGRSCFTATAFLHSFRAGEGGSTKWQKDRKIDFNGAVYNILSFKALRAFN